MARFRKYGEDLTYGEWHRHRLPELYKRIGHRLDMADRDFTEFCHFCKEPLMIHEIVRNVGQNLRDKATTVTRRLAERSVLDAYLVAYEVNRTWSIQREIDDLNERLRNLENRSSIQSFKVRRLFPQLGIIQTLSPDEWAQWLLIQHRSHHVVCARAQIEQPVVHRDRLAKARVQHQLSMLRSLV